MDIKSLIGMSFICAMGAISPGPSLAVVLRNTISGGRTQGVMTGIGHGIGLGIYAFIAVMGLSSLLLANKQIFNLIQWAGALVLIWLAFNMITYNPSDSSKEHEGSGRRGFLEGFMIAFLNPKILVFMVAVFSQFINPDITNSGRFIMAIMAGVIDTTWYVLVAAVLAGTPIVDKLRVNAVIIDRSIGMVLLMLAILLIVKTLGLEIS
jgi:threonine/homoserine/homoserine lactone efflux protein|tara:strand:+ start:510 stop:1133 length:624 start_codon:yes stop_codon:yes gene_type:complete